MSMYLIKVERDSVCMGDDINAPHEYGFELPADATLSNLFEHLARKRYLASVAGKNYSWEAIINSKIVAFFKGNNNLPEPSKELEAKISKYVVKNEINVFFKYNSSAT